MARFRGRLHALLASERVRLRLSSDRKRLALFALVAALLTAGPAGAGTTEARQRAAAEEDAASLLAAAMIPDRAQPLDGPPVGDGGALSGQAAPAGWTNAVTQTKWFRVIKPVSDVLAWIKANPPARTTLAFSGSGDTTGGRIVEWLTFQRPPVPHLLGVRWLVVATTALDDGSTGIRADAYTQWIWPTRSAATIVRGAHDVVINAGKKKLHVTRPKQVNELVTLFNRLDFQQPGGVIPCERAPAKEPPHPRVSFRTRAGGKLLGYMHVRPSGCARATIVVGGTPYESLDLMGPTGTAFMDALRRLGVLPKRT